MNLPTIVQRFVADTSGYVAGINQMSSALTKFVSLGTGLTAMAGGLLGAASLSAAAYKAIELANAYEKVSVSFKVMLGSAADAQKLLKDIDTLAVNTPFTSSSLTGTAKMLKAYGVDTKDLVPTLRVLGDVASGVEVDINRIALAYGQVISQGKLMGGELLQFTQAGVPVNEYLAKILNVPKIAVRELSGSMGITADKVTQAFILMTSEGGKFFNQMAEQSQTVLGKFSNVQDVYEIGLRRMAEAFLKGFGVGDILDKISDFLSDARTADFTWLEKMAGRAREVFDVIMAGVQAVIQVVGGDLKKSFEQFAGSSNWENWRSMAVSAVEAIVSAVGMLINVLRQTIKLMGQLFDGLAKLADKTPGLDFTPDKKAWVDAQMTKHGRNSPLGKYTNPEDVLKDRQTFEMYYDRLTDEQRQRTMWWATGRRYNPLAIMGDTLKGFGGDGGFDSLRERILDEFRKAVEKMFSGPPVTPEARKITEEARLNTVMKQMREQFALTVPPGGLTKQATELYGKMYENFIEGNGDPSRQFNIHIERLKQLQAYRDKDDGKGAFDNPQLREALRMDYIGAYKQRAAGLTPYQPLSGVGIGTQGEVDIIVRSRETSKSILAEVADTLKRSEQELIEQTRLDNEIADALRQLGFNVPQVEGGRIQ